MTMKHNKLQSVGAYIRVSSKQQAENGQGLDSQRSAIEAYAKQQGWAIAQWFEDKGVSGDEENRPAILDLTTAVEAGEINTVLVDRLDRLSRRLLHQEIYIDKWQRAGAEVCSVAEPNLGGEDEERVFFRQMMGAVNELQKALLLRRMRRGRLTKAGKGGFAAGGLALGYRTNGKALRIVEEEAEVVRLVHKMRKQQHWSYHHIAKELNERGVPTKRGGKWYAATVRKIVLNPIYRGIVHFAGVTAKGTHEPIV